MGRPLASVGLGVRGSHDLAEIAAEIADIWADHVELVNAYVLSENTQMNWRELLKSGSNHRLIGRPGDSTTS